MADVVKNNNSYFEEKNNSIKTKPLIELLKSAHDWSRTSTFVRIQTPQACASTNSATCAKNSKKKVKQIA